MKNAIYVFLVITILLFIPLPVRSQLNCSGGPCGYPNGSAAAPSFYGTNFPTTGGYWSTNFFSLAINGIESFKLGANTIVLGGGSGAGLTLGGTPSINAGSSVSFVGSNSVTNWKISTNDDVGGDIEFKPSTAPGGSTWGTNVFRIATTGAIGTTVTAGSGSTTALVNAAFQMRGNAVLLDGTPTCSGAGCALTAGSINSSGSLTTTTTGAADITVTFSANFANAPTCVVNNNTTANLLRATTLAVGSFHIQGTTVAGDTLSWWCGGR